MGGESGRRHRRSDVARSGEPARPDAVLAASRSANGARDRGYPRRARQRQTFRALRTALKQAACKKARGREPRALLVAHIDITRRPSTRHQQAFRKAPVALDPLMTAREARVAGDRMQLFRTILVAALRPDRLAFL